MNEIKSEGPVQAIYSAVQLLYINLTILCLSGTPPCVDSMDVIMGDIPLFPHVNTTYIIFSIKLLSTILCLNGTLSCVDFMDVITGDISAIHSTALHAFSFGFLSYMVISTC